MHIMALGKSISNMSIEEINRSIDERSKWIKNYLDISFNEHKEVDIEPLREWSNELYALNSARVQRIIDFKKSAY